MFVQSVDNNNSVGRGVGITYLQLNFGRQLRHSAVRNEQNLILLSKWKQTEFIPHFQDCAICLELWSISLATQYTAVVISVNYDLEMTR